MTLVRLEPKTLTRRRCSSIARLVAPGGAAPSARNSSRPLESHPRNALLIGTSQYRWRPFSRLASTALDLHGLHEVLTAPDIGGFEAPAPLCDQPAFALAMELESFFRDRERDDLLLLYVAGQVLLDEHGAPFLITHATDRGRWRSSVIDFNFLRDVMDQSGSKQQVILLDCAFGALAAQAPALGARIDLEAALGGAGRAVVSASNSVRYRLDDDSVCGDANTATCLRRMVHGLRTGEADLDGDGCVALDELARYASFGAGRCAGDSSGSIIARSAQRLVPPAVSPPAVSPTAREPRITPLRRARSPRTWDWASHAASSVASWLAEHVGR